MNEVVELLRKIYSNAKNGADTLFEVRQRASSDEFVTVLEYQRGKYLEIAAETSTRLAKLGETVPEDSFAERLGLKIAAIQMSLDYKKTAELVIEACSAGIVETVRALNRCTELDLRTRTLAEVLTDTEQKSMYYMMKYL